MGFTCHYFWWRGASLNTKFEAGGGDSIINLYRF